MPSEKGTDYRTKKLLENNRGVITISESGTVSMPTDTVWMTIQEIADMYNVFGCYVRKAVKAIFKDGILKEQGVRRHVRKNDRISDDVYSLELVIAVAFRIDSIESRAFREFIMQSVIGRQTSRTKLVCIFTEKHNLAKKYPKMVIGFDKVMKEMRTPSENWPIPEDAESGKK